MPAWIDFRELRAKLDFEQVLRHYGVEVKRKGDQHHGWCPLPDHKGKRNSPSFSANLARGVFHCFGCGAKGNVLDFAALMEGVDPRDGAALRKVAVKLQNQFCPAAPPSVPRGNRKPKAPPPQPKDTAGTLVNPPLDFELKGLDPAHPYLQGRGFAVETMRHFGAGFCSRGLLAGRIAIPLHSEKGVLVGYVGRAVDDSAIGENNPRYRFPSKRERDGKIIEFRKSLLLYNAHRLKSPVDDLVVIEGFASVWWLHQNGLPHAVATMGADCSERQAELIAACVKPLGRVWLLPDGDEAGKRFAHVLLERLSPLRFVRWVRLEKDVQPTDLSAEQLQACLKH